MEVEAAAAAAVRGRLFKASAEEAGVACVAQGRRAAADSGNWHARVQDVWNTFSGCFGIQGETCP